MELLNTYLNPDEVFERRRRRAHELLMPHLEAMIARAPQAVHLCEGRAGAGRGGEWEVSGEGRSRESARPG